MKNGEKKKFIIDKYKIAMKNHKIFEDIPKEEKVKYDNKIWNEFQEKLIKKIPLKLYKYQSVTPNHIDSLINDRAYFSSPEFFNDSIDSTINFDIENELDFFDNNREQCLKEYCILFFKYLGSLYNIDLDINEIDEMIKIYPDGKINERLAKEYLLTKTDEKQANDILRKIKQTNKNYLPNEFKKSVKGYIKNFININKHIKEQIKVYCLSEDCDNDMMWGQYADNSTGYCIEYCLDIKNFYDEKMIVNTYPIYYGKKPNISFINIFKKSIFDIKEKKYSGICLSDWININLSIFIKNKEWEHENEWRVILDSSYEHNLQKFPYISSIILGEKISNSNKMKLIKIAKEKNINIYERKMSLTESSVKLVKINY